MHIRSSVARGTAVIDDSTQLAVGVIDEPLVDPDTGRLVGFFVLPVSLGDDILFLQTLDIASWGTRIHVLSADRLGPPEDFVRLKSRLEDPRPFLGQPIIIHGSRKSLGILEDVQFNTRHFAVEWLFPRKFFFIRQPIPVTDIVEVTPEAIWVKDPLGTVRDRKETVAEAPTEPLVVPDPLGVQGASVDATRSR